jgi:hypothetical protein
MDGDFSKWPRESKIILGECRGQYRLIALYSRPLTAKEVLRNHESGPDQRGDGFP